MFEDLTAFEQASLQPSLDQYNNSGGLPMLSVHPRQRGAPDDLRVVSWPQGKNFADVKGYKYDGDWRRAPTVYIIDTGVDTTSRVRLSLVT